MSEPRAKWWVSDAAQLPEHLKREYEVGPLDYENYVVRQVDGESPQVIGSDGGEPEDQNLSRDFRWVVDEMQAAYLLGLKHGKESKDG